MKLDLLVFAAHPDDAELSCSGTILSFTEKGRKAGIIDLTEGELGTRGTVEDRRKEADEASKVLKLSVRENAGLKDGFFSEDKDTLYKIVYYLRKYRPAIVICNSILDRHPDHGNGGALVSRACFLAGLRKVETFFEGKEQEVWRPSNLYHYIQDRYLKPDFIVDITPYWEKKVSSIRAFKSQFYDPNSTEPLTYISNPDFLNFIEARARGFGHDIGVTFGEGFITDRKRMVGVRDLSHLI